MFEAAFFLAPFALKSLPSTFLFGILFWVFGSGILCFWIYRQNCFRAKNEQTESVKTLEPPLSTSLIYFLFFFKSLNLFYVFTELLEFYLISEQDAHKNPSVIVFFFHRHTKLEIIPKLFEILISRYFITRIKTIKILREARYMFFFFLH